VPPPPAGAEAAVPPAPATVRDVELSPFWREARKTIAGFEPMMRQLTNRPDLLSPQEFDTLLKSIPEDEAAARRFINQFNAVLKRLEVNKDRPLPGVEAAIMGLASTDPFVQDAALFLVESAAKVTNPVDSGLFFADAILRKLSLKDVD